MADAITRHDQYMQIICPHCQALNSDPEIVDGCLLCYACGKQFLPAPENLEKPAPSMNRGGKGDKKIRFVILMIFGLIAISLVMWYVKKVEGPKEKTWREFSNEAEPMMLAEASNHIVGFRRMLHDYVDDHGDYKNPNVWTGKVEAEYINPIGGVSVTNVPFKFNLDSSYDGNMELHCSYDWKKDLEEQSAREKAQFEAELKAAGNPR